MEYKEKLEHVYSGNVKMRIEARGPRFAVLCCIGARPHSLLLSEIMLKLLKSAFWSLYFGQR